MTTAYGSGSTTVQGLGKGYAHLLPWIPARTQLRDGRSVKIDFLQTAGDVENVRGLLNMCIEEGYSWPFDQALSDKDFRGYFLGHAAIVLRADVNGSEEIVGAFYCKPNFPGRCSHFCNGGFITSPLWRRLGIAQLMAITFLRVAKNIGFRASLFNLVFEHNVPSICLWEKLGFIRVGTLPDVVRLDDDRGFEDAHQYHFNLTKLDDDKLGQLIDSGEHCAVQNIAKVAAKLVDKS